MPVSLLTRRAACAGLAAVTTGLDARPPFQKASTAMSSTVPNAGVPPDAGRMLTRLIPHLNEPLGVVGLGTWQVFDVATEPAELAPRREILEILFAAGGRMIDSSPMYGRSEAVVGTLLSQMQARDKAFLATKVWTSGEAAGIAQMGTSAARLQTKTIDLMQIHNLVDWRTHLKTLRAWKAQGTFRAIGITHYTTSALDDLAAILKAEPLDVVQMAYALDVRTAEQLLLPVAQERGVAVLVNRPFSGGTLFSKVRGKPLPGWAAEIGAANWGQIFLKYLLGHPAVTCVIPGTAKPDHMRDAVAAGIGPLPTDAQRRQIATWWDAQ